MKGQLASRKVIPLFVTTLCTKSSTTEGHFFEFCSKSRSSAETIANPKSFWVRKFASSSVKKDLKAQLASRKVIPLLVTSLCIKSSTTEGHFFAFCSKSGSSAETIANPKSSWVRKFASSNSKSRQGCLLDLTTRDHRGHTPIRHRLKIALVFDIVFLCFLVNLRFQKSFPK